MEITFKNIDSDYKKIKPELRGDIQPKFWFKGIKDNSGIILVKRQHSQSVEKNKPKSKMFNHVGEYFGYLIAQKAGLRACPVDLITIHDTRNKYSKTLNFFTGCASHSVLDLGNNIISGEEIIDSFVRSKQKVYLEFLSDLTQEDSNHSDTYFPQDLEDNIDLAVLSIMNYTIQYEKNNTNKTKKEIASDVNENLRDFFDMVVYDCLFGNNDRHSGNWSLESNRSEGRVKLYPMYDNEAVLGLRKPIDEVRRVLSVPRGELPDKLDEELFSRMGFGPNSSKVSYKEMLEYLIQKYPEYVIPSLKKITSRVDEDFINELYDGIKGIHLRGKDADELSIEDELPTEYGLVGRELFSSRKKFALELLKEKEKTKDPEASSKRIIDKDYKALEI